MPKVLGQNLPRKRNHIEYDESHIILVPTNDLLVLGMLSSQLYTSKIQYVFSKKDAMVSVLRAELRCCLYCIYYNIQSMANLGLSIRIPKESLIKLGELQGKELVIKFNGGREVAGKLKSWDKTMNLILEGTQEMLGIDQGVETSRVLGLVIVKGSQIQSICLKNGYEVIDNPYAQLAE